MAVSSYRFSRLDGELADHGVEDALASAAAEAGGIRARAHAAGLDAGSSEGRAELAAQAAPALAALTGAASALDAGCSEAIAVLQEQAAELALAVAEQILSAAVAVDRDRVVAVCQAALRRLTDRQTVTVRVHPEDLEVLSGAVDDLAATLGGIERIEVQADRRIERGGVVLHTEHGVLDATIATQLAQAREIVAETLRGDDGDA